MTRTLRMYSAYVGAHLRFLVTSVAALLDLSLEAISLLKFRLGCRLLELKKIVTRLTTQHLMEAIVVDSPSNLTDKFLPLTPEEQYQLQKKVAYLLFEIKECKKNIQLLETEHGKMETSIKTLLCQKNELDERKTNILDETKQLHWRIGERNCGDAVQDLIRMLKLVKDLERKESDFSSDSESRHEDVLQSVTYGAREGFPEFDQTLSQSMEKLAAAKKELAAKLRSVLSVKRKIGDVPTQVELIQYERKFSELYSQIRGKHKQTCKFYDTYNSLLEIKQLMQKETSLLNSINSQFQDALTSTEGRSKLVDSMEVIVKGAQQKLEKVQLSLLAEKKNSDSLREKYIAAVADQRQFSSLLKDFQDECAKNERLRLAV
ncbi:Coiled-coil domain-containing protein [Canna indica]|uniref:Coiled-coil domain-containing protein n=1 Tax=Canna indica TaxID=4628 RepID=A0AAQ3KG90_9LILI|nr:Coiled-coil domain-containing protein [Canna indica]